MLVISRLDWFSSGSLSRYAGLISFGLVLFRPAGQIRTLVWTRRPCGVNEAERKLTRENRESEMEEEEMEEKEEEEQVEEEEEEQVEEGEMG